MGRTAEPEATVSGRYYSEPEGGRYGSSGERPIARRVSVRILQTIV